MVNKFNNEPWLLCTLALSLSLYIKKKKKRGKKEEDEEEEVRPCESALDRSAKRPTHQSIRG